MKRDKLILSLLSPVFFKCDVSEGLRFRSGGVKQFVEETFVEGAGRVKGWALVYWEPTAGAMLCWELVRNFYFEFLREDSSLAPNTASPFGRTLCTTQFMDDPPNIHRFLCRGNSRRILHFVVCFLCSFSQVVARWLWSTSVASTRPSIERCVCTAFRYFLKTHRNSWFWSVLWNLGVCKRNHLLWPTCSQELPAVASI